MWKQSRRALVAALALSVAAVASAGPINILYMNSTRGSGTGTLGNFRSVIASGLDDYSGGVVFDVDFVETQTPGDLAASLNARPAGHYNQIWFDTTIQNTNVLNGDDLTALNAWAANGQPEFILDSSFFFRNKTTTTMRPSAEALTINQALALHAAGGGILIGTDHDPQFTQTANAILNNFGFDTLFSGIISPISTNAAFTTDLLLAPEAVDEIDFFANHLSGLSTSNTPTGLQQLNANGGNRLIQMIEQMFSLSPAGNPSRVTHISTSFQLPEPGGIVLLGMGLLLAWWRRGRS